MGGKKDRKMCKWKKEQIDKDLKEYKAIVKKPKYVCKSCGRVADKKKRLCKAESLD